MDAQASIFGGIGWLYHKAAVYSTRLKEEEGVNNYTIKKGDTYEKIAPSLGTTPESIRKNNPKVNPRKLKIGQIIKFRKAREVAVITGWRSWDNAVRDYNGGGNPRYLQEVLESKREIEK